MYGVLLLLMEPTLVAKILNSRRSRWYPGILPFFVRVSLDNLLG